MAYPGDEEWYHDTYDRHWSVGDIYAPLQKIAALGKPIPISFYYSFIPPDAVTQCKDAVESLNTCFGQHGMNFSLCGLGVASRLPWEFDGIQAIVRLMPRNVLERYHGKGIISVSPLMLDRKTNGRRKYALAHGVGHGIFGYGHHGEEADTSFDPARECLMDEFATEGKVEGRLCAEDKGILESLVKGEQILWERMR
jgi:hypothetical protein